MGQLLTANVATNLYWFGRYLERVESTLIEIIRVFDETIDVDKDAGVKFYKSLGIDIKYDNAITFLDSAVFGKHNGNLNDILKFARENAIISRSYINTEAFGEVIKLCELFQKSSKVTCCIDHHFIDQALSLISEIWGGLTQKQHREKSDYFIRLGKLVEKADFHLRLDRDKEFALIVLDEIDSIVHKLAPNASFRNHLYSDKKTIIESINKKIDKIVVE